MSPGGVMRTKAVIVAAAVVLAALLGALGLSVGWPTSAVAILALLGLVVVKA